MELENYLENLISKKVNGVHGPQQDLAKEICDYFQDKEYREMGLWTKVGKRIGVDILRMKLKEVQNRGVKNSHYLLKISKI